MKAPRCSPWRSRPSEGETPPSAEETSTAADLKSRTPSAIPITGRPRRSREQAPFFAVQIIPSTTDSFGALPITAKAEVVDEGRKPIPGFFAAGTIANAELFYEHYPISGASLCMGAVSGRIAASEAVKYLS